MPTLRSELDSDLQGKADDELSKQVDGSFSELIDTGKKLSQHSFLVNSGGAAAVLAFIGGKHEASFAFLPLSCFLVGVVASGLELRFLFKFFTALHDDAIERRSKFTSDQLPLEMASPSPDVGSCHSSAYGWAGVVSQLAFPIGVLSGLYAFVKSSALQ